MSRRTNDFQKLIEMLTQLLGDGAIVAESKMLTDLVSGEERKVDVYAEGTLAGHTVRIGIECRDHRRKQGVAWVEQMHTKHERLPTNLLILVSRSGFYGSALAKAKTYGIKTITPTRADSDLASEVLASLNLAVRMWLITGAWLSVRASVPTEWLDRNAHAVVEDNGQIQFYRSDGSQLVNSDKFNLAALSQLIPTDSRWLTAEADSEFEVETPPVHGPAFGGELVHAYWTADGEQPIFVPVATAIVRGRVKIVTQAVGVSPSGQIVYDGTSYLAGTTLIIEGQHAHIVISDVQRQPRTQADVPVCTPPPQPKKRPAGNPRRRRN
jgi:hypothetical protein